MGHTRLWGFPLLGWRVPSRGTHSPSLPPLKHLHSTCFALISRTSTRLCFYVIRSFLPSLPAGCRHAHPVIKTGPVWHRLSLRNCYMLGILVCEFIETAQAARCAGPSSTPVHHPQLHEATDEGGQIPRHTRCVKGRERWPLPLPPEYWVKVASQNTVGVSASLGRVLVCAPLQCLLSLSLSFL